MNAFQSEIIEVIRRFTAESPSNRLSEIDGTPIYNEPLVGFADGDDPLFEQYHRIIGYFHMTPRLALKDFEDPSISVVSWVLPIAEETLKSNRAMKEGCSLRWNHSRFQGDAFNNDLRQHLVNFFNERGFKAVAPALTDRFMQVKLSNGPASTWSERHVAYVAGLGTFSLTDALITKQGIAHRVGSVVCNAPLEPSYRPYTFYKEYCNYARMRTCGVCMKRCPVGAITPAGHNKLKCENYVMHELKPWLEKPGYLGDKYIGCGLCLTGVPCEHQIPH